MKLRLFSLSILSLCSNTVFADFSYDVHRNVVINVPARHREIIVSQNGAPHRDIYIVPKPSSSDHSDTIEWVERKTGESLPHHAVLGGSQRAPTMTFHVCRTLYEQGVHPGKLINGRCNISWGGNEISASHYQVLVSKAVHWESADNGFIPPNAVLGGFEHGRTLFICKAEYEGGIYPGKVVDTACNFAWNGREIVSSYYQVLVRN